MTGISGRWAAANPQLTNAPRHGHTPEQVAALLKPHQRRFLLACSTRPKKWATIRRHAKIPPRAHVHGMATPHALVIVTGPHYLTTLTRFGQQVAAVLRSSV